MAALFQKNNIEFKCIGTTANVPNNDVARLMYYLQCVCTAINCNNNPEIQRLTNYHNWSHLSNDEQKELLVFCYLFSPDILDNRVFFQNDALCGNSSNEFYTINQIRHQLVAAESIVIGGQTRVVNKIMTYKMEWMKNNYIAPMHRLYAKLNTSPTPAPFRPSVSDTSIRHYQTYISRPITSSNRNLSNRRSCCCICCSVFILILVIIAVGIGVVFFLKHKRII